MLDQSIYKKADEIINNHSKDKEPLIPIMQDIQKIYTTIAPEVLAYVAEKLGISEEDAYSSAKNDFSFDIKGRYVIKVCDGIACHGTKGPQILDMLNQELGLSASKKTTDDLLFTVERSSCLRACGQAPVMMVNDRLYPQMTPEKAIEVISQLRVEFNDLLEKGIENMPSEKAVSITGAVNSPGRYDFDPGTTLNDIINDICGGIPEGTTFKAARIGGAPGGSIIVTDLDYKVDFDQLKRQMIRTRAITILSSKDCIVDTVKSILQYHVDNEVCGKCVPCREGTKRMLEILEDITTGKGSIKTLELLRELGEAIEDTALCKLGVSFVVPVLSTISEFNSEYMEHITDRKCSAGTCKALCQYEIVSNLCRGCSKCARNCPVSAITGEIKNPFVIDQTKCIKCGACASGCPFKAITVK